ncbi:hypothetical protein CGRA01v4_00700 [Colletotrichum graminicola]|nr:hypothetical protein CGRA01v4_00700 [Colletotrichum graminicola]
MTHGMFIPLVRSSLGPSDPFLLRLVFALDEHREGWICIDCRELQGISGSTMRMRSLTCCRPPLPDPCESYRSQAPDD